MEPIPDTTPEPILEDTPEPRRAMILKRNKPPTFNGENYLSADVTSWIIKVKAYVRLSNDEEEKIEVAAGFLTGTADKWFIGVHTNRPFTSFNAFIVAFKTRFTRADDDR